MFAIHGNLLPYCGSYAEAVKVWEEAHEHPRMPTNWRGLKDKRDTSKLVQKVGDAVAFRYHHTDLVTWRPNSIEVRLYGSISSGVFANRFLPNGVHYVSHKGEYYVRVDGKYYCPKRGPLILNYDGEWEIDLSTVYQYTSEVLDKKRAAEIRKIVNPFLDWWESLRKLGAPPRDETHTHSMYDVLLSLKTSIEKRHIPPEHFRQLACGYIGGDPVDIMAQCYVLGGAVTKAPAPLGTPRPKTKYQGLRAWDIMSKL